jgi:crossover junction endodeoxyribonuclease RusA
VTEYRIDLPFTKPLNLNDRAHWRVKAKVTAGWRMHGSHQAQLAHVPPLPHFTVELHYVPRDKRRRDPENLIASLKPLVDGLVDAGIAPDDTPEFYTTTIPIIDPPSRDLNSRGGRFYAIVREIP